MYLVSLQSPGFHVSLVTSFLTSCITWSCSTHFWSIAVFKQITFIFKHVYATNIQLLRTYNSRFSCSWIQLCSLIYIAFSFSSYQSIIFSFLSNKFHLPSIHLHLFEVQQYSPHILVCISVLRHLQILK